ncbi:hypothetical protein OG21DRAFT_1506655 [Imleria badia]|nr:hypothetical protein OG21DRAFT_1506655 [Imleria badia]
MWSTSGHCLNCCIEDLQLALARVHDRRTYGLFYWASRLSLDSFTSVALYLGYLFLICLFDFLVTGTIGFLTSYWVVRSLLDITLYLSNWTGRLFSAPCYDVGWSLESQALGVTESKHGQSDPTDQACICPQTQPPSYESVRSGST